MRSLHVLHVIDGLGLGGAERMAVDLANLTSDANHRVSLAITRSADTLANELRSAIEILRLHRRSRFDVSSLWKLARYVRLAHVDVVHVHMRSSMSLLLPLRASRVLGAPVVFHDHYGTIEEDASVPPWFRIGSRFIDRYVGVSSRLGEWARAAGMDAPRVEVIENAIDLSRLRSDAPSPIRRDLGLSPEILLGVMVATLRRDKDIETALDGLATSQYRDRFHLIIAGEPSDAAYVSVVKARMRQLALDSSVTLLGGRRDVPALLRAADFALLSSRTESGPLVLIEYLYASRPIIATSVGDIGRRITEAGIDGMVPPRQPTAYAAALDDLARLSVGERSTRGEVGRKLVDGWDLRNTMPRWMDLYARTVGRA